MGIEALGKLIEDFARKTVALPVHVLDSDAYDWDQYNGVRFGHLHTALTLRALAGELHAARASAGVALTRVGYALLDHQRAFRDFEALLLEIGDEHFDAVPAPEARNPMRIQPLHAATAARSLPIVAALIAAGADVNARQQDDFTPLLAAQQNGDSEIEKVLRDAGAVEQ